MASIVNLSQVDEIHRYLSEKKIQIIWNKLAYELGHFRPTNSKDYMIQRLETWSQQFKANGNNFAIESASEYFKTKIICIIGDPYSGKTELLRNLREKLQIQCISVDEMLDEIIASGSELGKLFKEQRNYHQDYSSERITDLVYKQVKTSLKLQPKQILLEGFPRTMKQAIEFQKQFGDIDQVIFLRVDLENCKKRAMTRNLKVKLSEVTDFHDQMTKQLEPINQYFSALQKLAEVNANQTPKQILEKVVEQCF